jgi:hypothetical protein
VIAGQAELGRGRRRWHPKLSQVDVSEEFQFQYNATSFRVKARVAVACPVPDKSIQMLSIAGGASGQAAPARTAKVSR